MSSSIKHIQKRLLESIPSLELQISIRSIFVYLVSSFTVPMSLQFSLSISAVWNALLSCKKPLVFHKSKQMSNREIY